VVIEKTQRKKKKSEVTKKRKPNKCSPLSFTAAAVDVCKVREREREREKDRKCFENKSQNCSLCGPFPVVTVAVFFFLFLGVGSCVVVVDHVNVVVGRVTAASRFCLARLYTVHVSFSSSSSPLFGLSIIVQLCVSLCVCALRTHTTYLPAHTLPPSLPPPSSEGSFPFMNHSFH